MASYVEYEPYRDREHARTKNPDDDARRPGDSDFIHPSHQGSSSSHNSTDYPPAPQPRRSSKAEPLSYNAAPISGHGFYAKEESAPRVADHDVAESGAEKSGFAKFLAQGRYPIEQRIENKKRGIGVQKYPFVSWGLAVAMTCVMIYELVRNAQEQGTPISTKPVFNPMLGPSQSALINFGARYPLCMKRVTEVPIDIQFGCLNNTANPPTRLCSLEDVCGFGGFHGKEPNQWWRFITPIFIHAGLIHILLNMVAQILLSARVEKDMGSGGFLILYFSAGIFGNVLGGNFALVGLPSVGASGAIFGTLAATWVDLFAHWRYKYRPGRQLVAMIIELIVGIGLGYIPGIDNFAHLGGFFMGLLVSTTFYPVVSSSTRHKAVTWGLRLTAIPIAVILMVLLIRNFYTGDPYSAAVDTSHAYPPHQTITAEEPDSRLPLRPLTLLSESETGSWEGQLCDPHA